MNLAGGRLHLIVESFCHLRRCGAGQGPLMTTESKSVWVGGRRRVIRRPPMTKRCDNDDRSTAHRPDVAHAAFEVTTSS